ncbi:unnamed protein product [Darwinula stevensoni]|uniref:Peptidase S1 domain-containing protein n=1 Tax=Darwinula stevensoni TaxID=69355 RepID=A0A7R8XGK0_9CRUS|nr:unnamed protein product [Darwinula stevensoni]CAG0891525.1 unnamed protein product [Darwinula stevensoni]
MFRFLILSVALAWANAAPADILREIFHWKSDKPMPDGRIVGGHNADIEDIPWQVSFQTRSGFHFCGGSIKDSTHIITAAHCCDGQSASNLRVRAGSNRKDQGGTTSNVASIRMHGSYNP